MSGLVVTEDAVENVTTKDLGHFDVEVFHRPKINLCPAVDSGGERFTLGGALEDVNASGGVEDVPDWQRSVGVSVLYEDVSGWSVANDVGQVLPPGPPLGQRPRVVGSRGDLDRRIVHG